VAGGEEAVKIKRPKKMRRGDEKKGWSSRTVSRDVKRRGVAGSREDAAEQRERDGARSLKRKKYEWQGKNVEEKCPVGEAESN